MARRSTLRLKITFSVACILFIALVTEASVTWRKGTKHTSKPQISPSESTAESMRKRSTMSPITWRRSTIARRSTDAVESREIEESDELEGANSSQEEHIIEQEGEPEVKPLVPGSRPGFWFDSSRKKKPSSLLRPGTRRNSLFPTRSSTTTTSAPTTVSVAPLTIIPRTLPSVANFGQKNSSSRITSSARSTSSPIAFRRRFRTTKAAKISPTTNEDNQKKKNKVVLETDQETENDMTENANETEDLKNIEAEAENIQPIRPKIAVRRRPYNSTRLSWIRKNDRKTNRTTPIPQQLTTIASTSISVNDKDNISAKTTLFPRTRTNSKTKKQFTSDITRSRSRHTTVKTTMPPSNAKSSEEISSETDSKSDNENHVYYEEEDSVSEENSKPISSFGSRQNSSELRKTKLKTTVEPFYLTRDYGRIATAMPELKNKKERVESTTQDMKTDKEISTTVKTKLTSEVENVASKSQAARKAKKRIKLKTTEAPKQTTTIKGHYEDLEPDYDYEIIGVDTSVENVSNFEQNNTIKESFESPISNEERIPAKLEVDDISTTTTRPTTLSAFPTIDRNSNAYVVWSLGHGGSGWSYQKHGGQVKWSAQNSEAEGDNWSVVSRDEEESIQAALGHHWKPVRNSTTAGIQKSVKKSKIKGEISIPLKANTPKNSSPVTYIPHLNFKNETILSFNNPRVTKTPLEITNSSSSQFTPSLEYFGVKSIPNDNFTSYSNILPPSFVQDPQPPNLISQTPSPLHPTLENEFNEQVEGIINQYPIVPNYPYAAEIRDTYKNLPESVVTDAPATKLSEIEKYVTVISDEDAEKEPTSPSHIQHVEPFLQEPKFSSYPHTEKALNYDENYDKKISLPDSVISAQRPEYASAIPPELAKAVVEAKKWQVIGHGGAEGWSLLNEDGLLEWKIHNVDGQWKVTSAEQLKEVQIPHQRTKSEYRANEGDNESNSNAESYGYSSQEKQNLPKVWSLDDDYAKWRAVSAERTPAGVSSEEISTSSQEYGYDSKEYDSDYYSEEDYYNSPVVNEDVSSYNINEDYGSRPLWGDGENEMIYSQPKDYPQFSRNFEVANSREDAVAAWKSLVVQQGHWKFSDNGNVGVKTQPQHQTSASQNTVKTANRRTSTIRPRPEIKQKISHEPSRGNTRGQYVNQRNNRVEEKELTLRDHENNRSYKVRGFTEANLVRGLTQNQGQQREIPYKEGDFPNVRHRNKQSEMKNNTQISNIESLIESLVQNYQHRERDQPVTRLENEQVSKLIKIIPENNRHAPGFMGEKYDVGNQAKIEHLQHINERRLRDNHLQKGEYDSNTKYYYEKYVDSENENHFTNVQSHTRNEDRKNEGVLERRVRINSNDRSKIDSLITKLEAVQKEAKGRAVIDLSELLKHIKNRRNTTSYSNLTFLGRRNDKNKINNLPVSNKEQNQQEKQNLPRDVHYKLDTDHFDKTISHDKNDENNEYLKTNIRSKDYRNQDLEKTNNPNQRDMYVRSDNHSNENQVIKENMPLNSNSRIYPPARPTQQYRDERHNTAEKSEKDTINRKRYTISQDTYPKYIKLKETGKLANSDSSSSEKIIVDLRDNQPKKSVGTRRERRPSRRRSRKPNHPQPIVLKSETEVEEDGSRKNRKIIVIDYAGTPKKKTSVDKKDLELIIRNVKHRRSEIYEKHAKK